MITIAKPTFKVREVFLGCISTVGNVSLKKELTDCVDLLELAETDFDNKFDDLKIHQIAQCKIIKGSIDKAAMKKVYDYRMVRVGMPGNPYYDKIKSAAPHGKCPLCSVRSVDTLDHYLPKSKFPIFAVTPITLIPACTPCNKGKLVAFPKTSEEQTLHPYYDNIQDVSWLRASIIQTSPISFNYHVSTPRTWSKILASRTQVHFDAFHLNELFSAHANEELRGIKLQLTKLYNSDPALLIAHLQDSYNSRLVLGINSWQAVMYKSLLDNVWFCTGGVLQ